MSKKIRAIIAGGIVLLLLVAALIILNYAPMPKDSTSSEATSSEAVSIPLIAGTDGELENVKIKTQTQEYTIELIGENKWGIKEFDGIEQVLESYSSTVSSVTTLYATGIIEENSTDLNKFGFDKPTLVTEIKFKGQDPVKLTLGDLSSDGSVRYCIETGDNTVYAIYSNALSLLIRSKYDYIDKGLISPLEVGEDQKPIAPAISYVNIARTDWEKPITLEKYKIGELSEHAIDATGLKVTSPVDAMVDQSKGLEVYIYPVFGLTATDVAVINPTAEDKTKYGFDKPLSVFEMTHNETSDVKVTIGNGILCQHKDTEDLTGHKHVVSSYYALCENKDIIFILPSDSVKWLTMKPIEIVSTVAVLPPIVDLAGVEFKAEGKTYDMVYTQAKTEEDDIIIKANGKDADTDMGKKLIQLYYYTEIQDINTVVPTKKADASITYKYSDGKTDVLELYRLEDRKTILSLNGNYAYLGRAGYLEKLIKETKNYFDGKDVDTDW